MKLVVVGDTHCRIDHINFWVEFAERTHEIEVAAVLQPGDFGFYSPKQMGSRDAGWEPWRSGARKFLRPTIVVPGNHENPRVARDAMNLGGPLGAIVENFKCLDEGEIFGFSHNGEMITIMGCGGAYCVDKPPPSERYPHHNSIFTKVTQEWLHSGQPRVDILMTHEAPEGVPLVKDPRIQERFKIDPNKPLGDILCRRLWEAVAPNFHVSGHHHQLLFHEEQLGERTLKHLTADLSGRSAVLIDTRTWEPTLLRP